MESRNSSLDDSSFEDDDARAPSEVPTDHPCLRAKGAETDCEASVGKPDREPAGAASKWQRGNLAGRLAASPVRSAVVDQDHGRKAPATAKVLRTSMPLKARKADITGSAEKGYKFQVEQNMIGSIIGKGGQTLRMIEDKSGVEVKVDQSTREKGYSTVRIRPGAGAPRAKELIDQQLRGDTGVQPDRVEEMEIEQRLVGSLIGYRGETINDIKKQSGASVSFDQTTSQQGFSRLRIAGTRQAVAWAKALVSDKLSFAAEEVRGSAAVARHAFGEEDYDDGTERMRLDQKVVGYVIGARGETLREIQRESGARLDMDQSTREKGFSTLLISGTDRAIQRAKGIVAATVAEHPAATPSAEDQEVLECRMEQSCVPWLIGTKGQTLRAIEHKASVHIDVDQSTRKLGYSVVRIQPGRGQLLARRLVAEKIQEAQEKDLSDSQRQLDNDNQCEGFLLHAAEAWDEESFESAEEEIQPAEHDKTDKGLNEVPKDASFVPSSSQELPETSLPRERSGLLLQSISAPLVDAWDDDYDVGIKQSGWEALAPDESELHDLAAAFERVWAAEPGTSAADVWRVSEPGPQPAQVTYKDNSTTCQPENSSSPETLDQLADLQEEKSQAATPEASEKKHESHKLGKPDFGVEESGPNDVFYKHERLQGADEEPSNGADMDGSCDEDAEPKVEAKDVLEPGHAGDEDKAQECTVEEEAVAMVDETQDCQDHSGAGQGSERSAAHEVGTATGFASGSEEDGPNPQLPVTDRHVMDWSSFWPQQAAIGFPTSTGCGWDAQAWWQAAWPGWSPETQAFSGQWWGVEAANASWTGDQTWQMRSWEPKRDRRGRGRSCSPCAVGEEQSGDESQWSAARRPRSRDPGMLGGSIAEVNVEQQYVGRLIGKGGSVIQALSEKFGVELTFHQTTFEEGYSNLHIQGDADAVQNAKAAVAERIAEMKRDVQAARARAAMPARGGDEGWKASVAAVRTLSGSRRTPSRSRLSQSPEGRTASSTATRHLHSGHRGGFGHGHSYGSVGPNAPTKLLRVALTALLGRWYGDGDGQCYEVALGLSSSRPNCAQLSCHSGPMSKASQGTSSDVIATSQSAPQSERPIRFEGGDVLLGERCRFYLDAVSEKTATWVDEKRPGIKCRWTRCPPSEDAVVSSAEKTGAGFCGGFPSLLAKIQDSSPGFEAIPGEFPSLQNLGASPAIGKAGRGRSPSMPSSSGSAFSKWQ